MCFISYGGFNYTTAFHARDIAKRAYVWDIAAQKLSNNKTT